MISTDDGVCAAIFVVVSFLLTVTVVKLWRGEVLPFPLLLVALLCLVFGRGQR